MNERKIINQNLDISQKPQEVMSDGYSGGIPISPSVLGFVPIGIDDADEAVYNLFSDKLKIKVVDGNKSEIPVSVRVAGNERFALVQNLKLKGNENKSLVPPAISIERQGYDISLGLGNMGRYLGQDVGELSFIRRLGQDDQRYQNIINKYDLKNQDNVSVKTSDWVAESDMAKLFSSEEKNPRNRKSNLYHNYLKPSVYENIYEVIKIPFPKFFIASYKITFWTSHISHLHQMINQFISSFDARGNYFFSHSNSKHRIDIFCDDNLNFQNNLTNYSEVEREIKIEFDLKANGRCVGLPDAQGHPAFRRYISAIRFDFGIDFQNQEGLSERFSNVVFDRNGKLIIPEDVEKFGDTYKLVYTNKKSGESVLTPIKGNK